MPLLTLLRGFVICNKFQKRFECPPPAHFTTLLYNHGNHPCPPEHTQVRNNFNSSISTHPQQQSASSYHTTGRKREGGSILPVASKRGKGVDSSLRFPNPSLIKEFSPLLCVSVPVESSSARKGAVTELQVSISLIADGFPRPDAESTRANHGPHMLLAPLGVPPPTLPWSQYSPVYTKGRRYKRRIKTPQVSFSM
ncbi:hypothetical protein CEXT_272531 [Caerostris extrusa]|uniref:Uncharacterized protein n=1 Tax=Caerostris extrusa TaxID=172846 RepID=A0AAV4VBA4_CAEEX|nr:hypothetical protein CEXT_272531 [Caerostris extrusa]